MITKEGTLEIDNALIISKEVSKDNLNSEAQEIQAFFSKNDIKPVKAPISFSQSEDGDENTEVVPLQWIMPLEEAIDENFELPKGFKFKKRVRIRNIIKIQHKGHPSDLIKTKGKLIAFLKKNGYERSTPFHFVALNDAQSMGSLNEFEMDIFVGTKNRG